MSNDFTTNLQDGLIGEMIPLEDWTRKDDIQKSVSPFAYNNQTLLQSSTSKFTILFITFSIFYLLPIFNLHPTEHTCFAILITSIFFWTFDFHPYFNPYFISYLIPILSTFLQIGYDKGNGLRLSSVHLANRFASIYMSPEVFIILCALTIFKAVDKLQINRYICHALLKILQPYPHIVLFAFMIMNLILGCFFSTVATTTFFISLALPIIRSNDKRGNLSKAFLLGIAWSSNNASIISFVITDYLPYSHIETLIYTLPCILILTITECLYLLKVFKLKKHKIILTNHPYVKNQSKLNINKLNIPQNRVIKKNLWSVDHYFVIIIMFLYFFLISYYTNFDCIGIISLMPIVLIFGKGILSANEFNTLNWTAVALTGGIIALTEAIKMSGLFDLTFDFLFEKVSFNSKIIQKVNFSLLERGIEWFMSIILLFIISFFSSFFWDKTYIIEKISYLWNGSSFFLAMFVLIVNVSQLMHVSTLSNILAGSIFNNETNQPILNGSIFFRHGIISHLFAILIFGTVGYYLANSLES